MSSFEDVLKKLSTEELNALQAGDFSKISTDNLRLLLPLMQQSEALPPTSATGIIEQAKKAPVGPQRVRSLLQGLSLGAADEIEAAARSALPGFGTYGQEVSKIREQVGAYRKADPLGQFGWEALGGTIGGIAAAPFTGGTSVPIFTGSALARPAVTGAVTGGASAFATGEGDTLDRLSRVPMGVTAGVVAQPVVQTAVKGATAFTTGLLDFARRKFGFRPASAVDSELQRLAQESGRTVDEIVDGIRRGEIMAENQTLREAVRGYFTKGGEAASTLGKELPQRSEQLRKKAMGQVQEGLAPQSMGGNVLAVQRQDEGAMRKLEEQLYNAAFKAGGKITPQMIGTFTEFAKRDPELLEETTRLLRLRGNMVPFMKYNDAGELELVRVPTAEDMELARRALADLKSKAFMSGKGAAGQSFGDMERKLREQIDLNLPEVAKARSTYAKQSASKEAFESGRKALSKSADEIAYDFSNMTENQIKYFRAGVMDALRKQSGATIGSKNTLVKSLADPENKTGAILRTIFPGDKLDDVLGTLGLAKESQATVQRVLGGSPTAASLEQMKRQGMDINFSDITGVMRGDPMAAVNVASKLVSKGGERLTEKQRSEVVRVLLSQDPEIVRKALTDEGAMRSLMDNITRIGGRLSAGAGFGATHMFGSRMQNLQQQ